MRKARWAALFILLQLPSYPQFLPDLQAQTTEEYDAYLAVLDGPVVEKGPLFEQAYPKSSLRLPVCERLAAAFRTGGQRDQAIAAASRGLAITPDYIPLLVELADLLANGSPDLDRASEAAQRALTLLQTAKAPQRISPEDWIRATATLKARAHSALGLISFKRNNAAGAIAEFETALQFRTSEDPMIHYRLGRLLALDGRKEEAKRHLREAARSGETQLRELAAAALGAL